MKDGIINLDSERGAMFGFTTDKFQPYSYLWCTGNRIMISLIGTVKQGNGDLAGLFDAIRDKGYEIAVPTPSGRMRTIMESNGFEQTEEEAGEPYPPGTMVEVWVRGAP